MQDKLYIILVCFNQKNDIGECLDSLAAAKHPIDQIVVFDNGSTDGSIEIINAKYPEAMLIKSDKNVGFAEANNRAVRLATIDKNDYALLLNSDTTVTPNFTEKILEIIAANKFDVFGPKILDYYDPTKIWFAGGFFDIEHCNHSHRGIGEINNVRYDDDVGCDFITGCALVIRKSLYIKLHGFNPKLFMYCEDLDLCLRAKKRGASIGYTGNAALYHKIKDRGIMQTRPLTRYYYARNMLYVIKTQRVTERCRLSYTRPLLYSILRHIKLFIKYPPLGLAGLLGICDFIFARAGKCPKYAQVLLNYSKRFY